MKVHVYSNQDYHTPHERLASYKIREQLGAFTDNAEDVWLLENVGLGEVEEQKSDGTVGLLRSCEPDLIVVKQSGIIVVELKHWEGLIEYPTKGEDKAHDWYSTRAFRAQKKRIPTSLSVKRKVPLARLAALRDFPSRHRTHACANEADGRVCVRLPTNWIK